MDSNKSSLNIDYNKVALNDPQSFVKYALELNNAINQRTGGKPIMQISYMIGNYKQQGKARICIKGFSEICIDSPGDDLERAKLANLLWALSRGGAVQSHILFVDSAKNYDVTTTHAAFHAGRLQKSIKDALESGIAKKDAPEGRNVTVLTRELTPEQLRVYERLPKDKQELWRKFAMFSSVNGYIQHDRFVKLKNEMNITREELYEINEFFSGDMAWILK